MTKIHLIRKMGISMEEALTQFLMYRKARGIANSTLLGHKKAVSALIERCESWEDIAQQINVWMSEDIRNNTHNLRIKFLKPFSTSV